MDIQALIDADLLRYRIGFVCEKNIIQVFPRGHRDEGPMATFEGKTAYNEWLKNNSDCITEEDLEITEVIEPEPVENCLHSVKQRLQSILDEVSAKSFRLFLTGKDNYRDSLVDYYKANRDRTRRPYHFENITNYLVEHWNAEIINGREADDACGIAQFEDWMDNEMYGDAKHRPEDHGTIICSIDKDLDMIPGWHYHFVKQEKYFVTENEARDWFYCQLLTGDMGSDNIPGLFHITGTKVRDWKPYFYKISELSTDREKWDYIVKVYVAALLLPQEEPMTTAMEDATVAAVQAKLRETGKLLWIQRDLKDNWEPPCDKKTYNTRAVG